MSSNQTFRILAEGLKSSSGKRSSTQVADPSEIDALDAVDALPQSDQVSAADDRSLYGQLDLDAEDLKNKEALASIDDLTEDAEDIESRTRPSQMAGNTPADENLVMRVELEELDSHAEPDEPAARGSSHDSTIKGVAEQIDRPLEEEDDPDWRGESRTERPENIWKAQWQDRKHGPRNQADRDAKSDKQKSAPDAKQALTKYAAGCAAMFAVVIIGFGMLGSISSKPSAVTPTSVPINHAGTVSIVPGAGIGHVPAPRTISSQSRSAALRKRRAANREDQLAKQEALKEKAFQSQLDQMDVKALKQEGYKCLQRGEFTHAVAMLARAGKLDPNDSFIREYLAYALASDEDPVNALAQFKAFKQLSLVSLKEQMAFGTVLAHAANQQPAQTFFDQLILELKDDNKALLQLEEKCEELGLNSQASSAAMIGMKSEVPAERAEFRRIYSRLTTKKEAAPTYDKSLPRLS